MNWFGSHGRPDRKPSLHGDVLHLAAYALSITAGACGGANAGSEQSVSTAGTVAAPVAASAGRAVPSAAGTTAGRAAAGSSVGTAGAMAAGQAGSSAGGQSPTMPPAAAAPGASAASGGSSGVAAVSGTGGATNAGSSGAAPSNSNDVACDRACLTQLNDGYLQALVAKDPSKLSSAPDVRFTENGKTLKLGEGLWAVAKSLGEYRQDFAEVPAGQTAGFASLQDDKGAVLLAFRLKVVARHITEIESTVCRTGEATFFSPANLKRNPLFDREVDPGKRVGREALTKVVDLYFQGIESSDGSQIPFDSGARRNENGTVTGMGMGLQNVAMFSYIDKIDRRYVLVDEERGNVLPWILFQIPMGIGGSRTLHLAEAFKVEDGKIMDVQAIMVNQPLGTPSGWE